MTACACVIIILLATVVYRIAVYTAWVRRSPEQQDQASLVASGTAAVINLVLIIVLSFVSALCVCMCACVRMCLYMCAYLGVFVCLCVCVFAYACSEHVAAPAPMCDVALLLSALLLSCLAWCSVVSVSCGAADKLGEPQDDCQV